MIFFSTMRGRGKSGKKESGGTIQADCTQQKPQQRKAKNKAQKIFRRRNSLRFREFVKKAAQFVRRFRRKSAEENFREKCKRPELFLPRNSQKNSRRFLRGF
jgi:hypothetical protein